MIQVSNLTRYYGDFPALRDVSFEVSRGEIIGLLGLNGAGKSTALKILAGVLAPSGGSVTMDGKDVATDTDSLKETIGFLPEEPPLYRDMTVSKFLVYAGQMKGMDRQTVLARLPEIIASTGLKGRENQIIDTLSHGFKKRVGIAMAVIHNPSLVILDEPISGLDPVQIKEMRSVIHQLGKDRAVLISSHNLTEIGKTCDRLVVLHQGKMVAQGTLDELNQRPVGRVNIAVRGDAAALSEWLDGYADVQNHVTRADGALAVSRVQLNGDKQDTLVTALTQAGFAVHRVEEPAFDLEEIFIGLTTTRKASAPAPSDDETDEVQPTEEMEQ